jgi:hypothetical protein
MAPWKISIFFILLILLSGCISQQGGSPSSPEGPGASQPTPLSTGRTIDLVTSDIPPKGGIIRVDKPGDPLDGLTIDIPNGAYNETTHFDISYKKIKDPTISNIMTTISPLISIKNASEYANLPIIVTIPVIIPEGNFAMVFFYNEKEGISEALPLIEENATSITVITRHFSDLVALSTNKENLMTIKPESGYIPGVDTWQIESLLTRITPGGTCSGNSVMALWYYLERKLKHGDPKLFGQFNSTNAHENTVFWEDDSNAIVLTAIITNDLNYDRLRRFRNLDKAWSDSEVYMNFVTGLEVTKKPQLMSMWGKNREGNTIAHLVVVYKAENGKLYFADPNYPASTKPFIVLKNGKFSSYGPFYEYDFYGISSLENWKLLAQRWECFSSDQYSGACFDKMYPEWGGGIMTYTGSCGGGNGFLCYLRNRQKCVITTNYNNVYKISICPEITGLKNEFFFQGKKVLPENIRFDPGENVIGIYSYKEDKDGFRTWYGFDYLTVMYEPTQLEPECYRGSFTYPTYWTEPFCYYMIVTPKGFTWSHN